MLSDFKVTLKSERKKKSKVFRLGFKGGFMDQSRKREREETALPLDSDTKRPSALPFLVELPLPSPGSPLAAAGPALPFLESPLPQVSKQLLADTLAPSAVSQSSAPPSVPTTGLLGGARQLAVGAVDESLSFKSLCEMFLPDFEKRYQKYKKDEKDDAVHPRAPEDSMRGSRAEVQPIRIVERKVVHFETFSTKAEEPMVVSGSGKKGSTAALTSNWDWSLSKRGLMKFLTNCWHRQFAKRVSRLPLLFRFSPSSEMRALERQKSPN
jgi:hypothetical protein